jgi:hypothetical protein
MERVARLLSSSALQEIIATGIANFYLVEACLLVSLVGEGISTPLTLIRLVQSNKVIREAVEVKNIFQSNPEFYGKYELSLQSRYDQARIKCNMKNLTDIYEDLHLSLGGADRIRAVFTSESSKDESLAEQPSLEPSKPSSPETEMFGDMFRLFNPMPPRENISVDLAKLDIQEKNCSGTARVKKVNLVKI